MSKELSDLGQKVAEMGLDEPTETVQAGEAAPYYPKELLSFMLTDNEGKKLVDFSLHSFEDS